MVSITDKNKNLLPDDDELIDYIILYGRYRGTTPAGNGIGSFRDQVEAEFGPSEKEKMEDDTTRCSYLTKGITFIYNSAYRVEEIHIYLP